MKDSNLKEKITIVANGDEWQEECWALAKEGKTFKVDGVKPGEFPGLCRAIRDVYYYSVISHEHSIYFTPLQEMHGD